LRSRTAGKGIIISAGIFLSILLYSCSRESQNPFQDASLPPLSSHDTVLELVSDNGTKSYTINELEALGLKRLETGTFWPADDGIYEGILLADLLKDRGLYEAEELLLTAYDGYMLILPREKWTRWHAFLATRRDGQPIELKSKGPTRIIFPMEMDKALQSNTERSFWIWSLKRIEEKR
jgi:hypothetical protein